MPLTPSRVRRVRLLSGVVALATVAIAAPAAAWDGSVDSAPDPGITAQVSHVRLNNLTSQATTGMNRPVSLSIDFDNVYNSGLSSFVALPIGWAGQTGPIGCIFYNSTNYSPFGPKHGTYSDDGSTKFRPAFNSPATPGSYWLQWSATEAPACNTLNTGPWTPVVDDPENFTVGHLFVGPAAVKTSVARATFIRVNNSQNLTTTAGTTVTVRLHLSMSPTCTTCRYQVVVGWSESAAPTKCLYNGKPGTTGVDADRSFTLVVPDGPDGVALPNHLVAWQVRKTGSTTCDLSAWPKGAPAANPSQYWLAHVVGS